MLWGFYRRSVAGINSAASGSISRSCIAAGDLAGGTAATAGVTGGGAVGQSGVAASGERGVKSVRPLEVPACAAVNGHRCHAEVGRDVRRNLAGSQAVHDLVSDWVQACPGCLVAVALGAGA